jgi:hypothetical protein
MAGYRDRFTFTFLNQKEAETRELHLKSWIEYVLSEQA